MPSSLTNLRTHTLLYHTHILTSSTYYPASPMSPHFVFFSLLLLLQYETMTAGDTAYIYMAILHPLNTFKQQESKHTRISFLQQAPYFSQIYKIFVHFARTHTHENIYIHTQIQGYWEMKVRLKGKRKKSSENDVILNDPQLLN